MTSDDEALRASLQAAQRKADGSAPEFDKVFGASEQRLQSRRKMQFVGLAAAAVLAVLALGLLPTQEQITYVDTEELVATTFWSAPSDSLLPDHQFDIYRELPELFESTGMSTNSETGALL